MAAIDGMIRKKNNKFQFGDAFALHYLPPSLRLSDRCRIAAYGRLVPLGEVAARRADGGSVLSSLRHSPSQKSEIFAIPLKEGAEGGFATKQLYKLQFSNSQKRSNPC